MREPLDCDAVIREHRKAEADAYFQRLWSYFRWREWETTAPEQPSRALQHQGGGNHG